LNNVLGRFIQCIEDLRDNDIVVRTTADNPLPNGELIDFLVSKYEGANAEYFGTTSPDDGLPYGLSAEVFSAGALRGVAEQGNHDALDFENVTTTLRRRAGSAGIVPKGTFFAEDFSHLRATIDTLDDYLAMSSIFEGLEDPVEHDWRSLIRLLPSPNQSRDRASSSAASTQRGSAVALGTAQLGGHYGIVNRSGPPSDSEAAEMLALAARSGVTHIDTARSYGNAEERIGRLLPTSARATLSVVTKLRPMHTTSDAAAMQEVEASIDASVYGSCRDLRMFKLDVVMFHRSDDMFRWQRGALVRLEELVRNGVVEAIGVSVYSPEEAIACLKEESVRHLQIPFNLLDSRWLCAEFQQALSRRPDVHVHARSVFLQGLLLNGPEFWPDWVQTRCEFVEQIRALVRRCERKNAADLCIAYVRSFPWITTVILGAETLRQTTELMALASEPALKGEHVEWVNAAFADVPARLLVPSRW
jgi:spore coat polysaccharide biosynthesis protein SpsF